jgi:hypothetical protein
MKTLCFLFAFIAILSPAIAQVKIEFGVKGGIAPSKLMGTAPLIVNRNDRTSDFLFNGNKVEFSPALGVAIKLSKNQFFFEGEATYYSIRKSYAMQYLDDGAGIELQHQMEESCKSIDFPLSAGVYLGPVQITSGLSARYEFGQTSSLTQMAGLEREIQSTVFGWHGGVGVNVGKISAELSYHQDFGNYGQGIYVNGQELLLKNSPAQLRFMVGLWF